jgi:signal transduction histidine kinase
MNAQTPTISHGSDNQIDLAGIVAAYNQVTEQLQATHARLEAEVRRLSDELERKNEELARREQLAALGEVAAGLAHEIRNPLAGLRLFAALITRPQTPPEEARDLAGKILEGLRTLEGTVNDILLFARQGACRPEQRLLVPLLEEAVQGVQHLVTTKRVPVCMDSEGAPEWVWVDRIQFLRALSNLLANAIEASRPETAVTLRVRTNEPVGDGLEICVEDHGPGIAPQDRPRIFEPFFTTKTTGTGLGLPMVHRIVQNHGGHIEALTPPEGGTCFRMVLPAEPEEHSMERRECLVSA